MSRWSWLAAILSGIVAVVADAAPTGSSVADVVLVLVGTTAVVLLASLSPWWTSTAAAGVGAALAMQPAGLAFGVVGFLIGAVAAVRPAGSYQQVVRATVAGLAVNSLIRSDLGGFLGLSAMIGIGVSVAMALAGVATLDHSTQRRGALVAIGVAAAAGVGVLVSAAVGLLSYADLRDAATTTDGAIAALDDGDYRRAADLFEQSADGFAAVSSRLDSSWTAPSRWVPAVAQNVTAGIALTDAAAAAAEAAGQALREIDPDTLRVSGGAVDLDAISAVEAPLVDVQAAFAELQVALDDARSPWLALPLQQELDGIDADIVEQRPRLDNVVDAVRLLPDLLGDGTPRTYLVLFTTPAEARGLGGFPGSYTTVVARDGEIEVGSVGRIEELNQPTRGADCNGCDEEFLRRYGRFGLTTGPGGSAGDAAWSNLTMAANFPAVADAAHRLFPQATGERIDGVIVMDPYVVQQFVEYGGAIELPGFGPGGTVQRLEPDEVAPFILRGQYELADRPVERLDALDALGASALTSVLGGELPEPAVLLGDLAELVTERRLLAWSGVAAEQQLFEAIGLAGSLPRIDPVDGGFSVSVTNAGGSKIDVFLDRTVDVEIQRDADTGGRVLVATVELTNGAPASGFADYVIGNRIGLPTGTSRLFVTFYGPSRLTDATLDGEPVGLEPSSEAGWAAYGHFVELEPGQRRTYRLRFPLPIDDGAGNDIITWAQPLAERSAD